MTCPSCNAKDVEQGIRCPTCRGWLAPPAVRILYAGILLLLPLLLIRAIYVMATLRSVKPFVVIVVTLVGSGLLVFLARGVAAGKKSARVIAILAVATGFILGNALLGATVLDKAEGLPAMLVVVAIAYEWVVLTKPERWPLFSRYFLAVCALVLAVEFALNTATVPPLRLIAWEITIAVFSVLATQMYAPSVRPWFGSPRENAPGARVA